MLVTLMSFPANFLDYLKYEIIYVYLYFTSTMFIIIWQLPMLFKACIDIIWGHRDNY